MEEEESKDRRTLRRLMKTAGYNARPLPPSGYEVAFHGKYRDFDVRARMAGGWLSLAVYILQLPPQGMRRAKLLEWAMHANEENALTKFTASKDETLWLELQYRSEHVDADTFANLIAFIRDCAETNYPSIFDIVNGQEALESLEDAFKRPSLTNGPDA